MTGSFQTIVTHGRARSWSSSTVVSGVRSGASGPATTTTLGRRPDGVRLRSPIMVTGSALLTDRYELTMVAAALADGTADRDCVFEVFARRLPTAGATASWPAPGGCSSQLPDFRFGDEEIAALREQGVTDERLLDWLAGYRFTGDIDGYAEGDLYFPGSPVLTVRRPFAEGVLLETLALSILNHDSAIASAAARMVAAGRERPSSRWARAAPTRRPRWPPPGGAPGGLRVDLEPGGRPPLRHPHDRDQRARLHPAARRREGGLPAQVDVLGPGRRCSSTPTTSTRASGRRSRSPGRSWAASAWTPATCRALATHARELLDSLGATKTRIVVTSDLDEYAIAGLMAAPVDRYGVGTSLVTGSGAPTAGMVYKLVERDGVPGGQEVEGQGVDRRPQDAVRRHDGDGTAMAEVVSSAPIEPRDGDRDLVVPLVERASAAPPSRRWRHWPRRGRTTNGRGRPATGGLGTLPGEPALDTVTA